MLDASRKAVDACRGSSRIELEWNEILTLAITRLVEIVGEAAKNDSDETRSRHPTIPWRVIAGTRDRLIHGYFGVDFDQRWQIVSKDLPELISLLERRSRPAED